MNFCTVEQALKWAYEMRTRPTLACAPLNGVRSVGVAQEDDRQLIATDILKRATTAVGYHEKAFLSFMFGYDDHWALPVLIQLMEELGVPARSRALELILKGYRGDKKAGGLRELRKTLGIGILKTASLRNHAYDYLDIMYTKVIDRLKDPLKAYLS